MRSNNTYYKPIRISRADDIRWNAIKTLNFKCKNCGHTMLLPAFIENGICSHCKTKQMNTSKARFEYRLYKAIRKEKER